MHDLKKAMRALADELDRVAIDFRRGLLDKASPPKQLLFDLQHRLDHLRQRLWDTRKLCDPFLVGPRMPRPATATASLAERVVRFVDEQSASDFPPRRRSG
jgi:hypothetical protein